MFGILILPVIAAVITLTIAGFNRGMSVRMILLIAGVVFVFGFVLLSNAISTVGAANFQANPLSGPAKWGIVFIISGLVSAVSLALLGIVRGLGRAQRNQERPSESDSTGPDETGLAGGVKIRHKAAWLRLGSVLPLRLPPFRQRGSCCKRCWRPIHYPQVARHLRGLFIQPR